MGKGWVKFKGIQMKHCIPFLLILLVLSATPGLDAVSAQESSSLTLDFSGLERPFYEKMAANFFQDPPGNALALVVLVGMIISVAGVGYYFLKPTREPVRTWLQWSIPVLSLIGLAVAGYLSLLGSIPVDPVCGPVGDCNAVQQSPYAYLFGIHVGLLGVAGYLVILAAWFIQSYGPDSWKRVGTLAVWGVALVGTLFSIYLTFLEPFVIGVTCFWCVTSAIVITLLLWGATPPAKQAWENFSRS